MRRALGRLCGRRCRFLAIVKFIGFKRQADRDEHTLSVLLVNVRIAGKTNSKRVTDHVWVPLTKCLTEMKVKRGVCLAFYSKVVEYQKWTRDEGEWCQIKDYTLQAVEDPTVIGFKNKNS
jgi:hypothetical protein